MAGATILSLFSLLSLLPQSSLGAIHEFNNVILPKDAFLYRTSGMFPSSSKGESFIKVDLNVARHGAPKEDTDDLETMVVQLAVFDQKVFDNGLGAWVKNKETGEKEHFFCCTQELVHDKVCSQPFTLILKQDPKNGVFIHTVDLSKTDIDRIDRTFPISSKGLKYMLISNCNDMTGQIVLNGKTERKNPYGYLPGELYGFLNFFYALTAIYLVLGLVWAVGCYLHWKQLMILQNYVTVVITLGMMEMALRYYDFNQFNLFGTRSSGLMLWASIMHTVKQTVSRLLVLVVSMGFGIVKPSLGDSVNAVWALGGMFFFFAVIQRVYELSSHTSAVTFMQYITMLPVALLDIVFFVWIFRSLGDVMEQLVAKASAGSAKLALYKSFRNVLFATLFVVSGWSVVYFYIVVSGKINTNWESRWMFDGFFDVLYLLVLLAIMILWRPNNNATQYAYSRVEKDVESSGTKVAPSQEKE